MSSGLLLALALTVSTLAMLCYALSLETHWSQLRGGRLLPVGRKRALRILGSAMLIASLWICVLADHPGMAVLV